MIESSKIDPPLLEAIHQLGLDNIEGAFAYSGGEELNKPNLGTRERIKLELKDSVGREHTLYLKRYGCRRLIDRLRHFVLYGPQRGIAAVEFDNIAAAEYAGVSTMKSVLYRQESSPLGGGRSFLIVTAVGGDAIERCGEKFLAGCSKKATAQFTAKLCELVRSLHRGGYVHRDLYASHIFLEQTDGGISLHLIDLARMFAPRWRQFRWRVKDLAQLKYSMPPTWIKDHWDAFLDGYLGDDAPRRQRRRYNLAIDRKVNQMRRRQQRREFRKTRKK